MDDDASSRLGFRVTLESAGYEVTEAEDGEEAMEYLRTDPADLALSTSVCPSWTESRRSRASGTRELTCRSSLLPHTVASRVLPKP